jgi:hypothetical protein
MVDCDKRQREIHKGTERHRCIHPEAETHGEVVSPNVCEACPLANLIKIKPCKDKRKEAIKIKFASNTTAPTSAQSYPLPVLEDNPEYPACPYRYEGKEGQMCSVTNLGVTPQICHRCSELTVVEEKKNQAKFKDKALNYFGAIRRWVASGRPTRSKEERAKLFEEHCKGCEMYDHEKHACKSCGCKVSSDADPLENKLAMATEHCPLGRF